METVQQFTRVVGGQPAHGYVGGRGEPVLLVHGGWGGASMHWQPVWDALATRLHVVAPDLPGIGRIEQRPLGSLGAYARWLVQLLDVLEIDSAWCVGNSLGASIVCRLAQDYPGRCRGLVLVNGAPIRRLPPLLRSLARGRVGRRLLWTAWKRIAYSPGTLRRAMYDGALAPEALRRLVLQAAPRELDAVVDVLIAGGTPPPYDRRALILWGQRDRLPTCDARAAERLHASWPGSRLVLVPRAGHLPQVENPVAFVDALTSFVGADAAPRIRLVRDQASI